MTQTTKPTVVELAADVTELYKRGYIWHLDERCDNPTIESLRSVLHDAGYTDTQIDERDYSDPQC